MTLGSGQSLPLSIRQRIFAAIDVERTYQDKQWGIEFDDRNTINDWVAYMNLYLARATEMDRDTKILDVEKVKKNLLKAITIGVAALETIERNGRPAARHYDVIALPTENKVLDPCIDEATDPNQTGQMSQEDWDKPIGKGDK